MNRPSTDPCPLCGAPASLPLFSDGKRAYLECPGCLLIFVPSAHHLPPAAEKERYDQHENAPDDPGYRGFLDRLFAPVRKQVRAGSAGLDFGCGPEPVLARMFEEAGHPMAVYDRFFARDAVVLEKRYDFITASEVAEHLREPRRELDRLWTCLRPGGLLGVMTRRPPARGEFGGWFYKNDPTHICFFSAATFTWLAREWRAELSMPEDDIALFRKSVNYGGSCG